jgi:hypothetical protein
MAKKVLFIVEGHNDEPDLIKQLYSECFSGENDTYDFYVFDTNIHQLAPLLVEDGTVDEDLDLLLVLKSETNDPDERALLSQKYSDVYLIFDFDPQQRDADLQLIHILLSYFTDSTNMGKLFINYPMMQSYKHLTALPDVGFVGRCVDHADVLHYKELVDSQALPELKQTKKYTFETFISLTYHHLMQARHILNSTKANVTTIDDLSIDYPKVFDNQLMTWTTNSRCFVLNTSLFILIEYKPKQFLQQISRHGSDYRI